MATGSLPGAQGTPESEAGSFECFQNYTAPEVFVQGLAGIVDQQDVESMIRAQKQMLQRFEKTNEMLTNCNQLSVSRLKTANAEFKKHTALLTDMKKDLDYIFKKIRVLKTKVSQQYPEAYNEAVKSTLAEEVVEDSEEDEQFAEQKNIPQTSKSSKTDKDTDSDEAAAKEPQFEKLRHRQLKRHDSSSTETDNEPSKPADSSSYSSDTS
ncbi:kxDL motif-containing protein CG10681 [Trichogramma pretiosum]|uniref:kxDL motif-containing protein CG10681 n=1 Tax=Trichogramma pretiosum TaxID=7493 RepID=UPI0006C9A1A0|nr:kxDL motif-containing protein CG10681 [Trichogramma pretiosum]